MGGRLSVYIHIDNGFEAQAGSALNGKVVVELHKALTAGGTLKLEVTGKEKVQIKHAGDQRQAQRQFFSVNLPLRGFPSGTRTEPGTYVFPFSIQLPASLPSSAKYPQGSTKNGFRIQYKAIATVGRNVRVDRYLVIKSAPLPDERVPCMIRPTTHDIYSAGHFKKGTVTIGASLEDSHVGRREDICLYLACQNDSVVNIQRVRIQLIEVLKWKLNAKVVRENRNILFSIPDVDVPGISRRKKAPDEVRRSDRATTYQAIYEDLASRRNKIDIRLPYNCRDTYKGQLVSITHYLEIKLMTPSMVSNPEITIPIRIGNPPDRPIVPPGQERPIPQPPAATRPAVASVPFEPEVTERPPQPGAQIPIADAVVIPENAVLASMVTATSDVIILGSDSVFPVCGRQNTRELSDLVPVAPPQQQDRSTVSLRTLTWQMLASVNDYDIISEHLQDPEWVRLFHRISPEDFGTIISLVNNESDQPRVAALLVPHLNDANGLTCRFTAEAVKNTSEYYRTVMVQRLVPMCVDILVDHQLISTELNEWEQTATNQVFAYAFDRARSS